MTSNGSDLANNIQSLLAIHTKAIEVINRAKNKNNHQISKEIGLAETTVSTILNQAKRFNYVSKEKGLWKKTKEITGLNLYRMGNIKFKSEVSRPTRKATSNKNPLTPLNYYKESKEMAECYVPIFCLENSLRDFLREIFKGETDWIKNRIDKDILDDIEKAKNEPYYAHKKRKDDLEYATLGHLLKIMISNKNWSSILPKLNEKDKKSFIATFQKILPSRNSTNHCVILDKTDRNLVESRVREITFMFNLK